MEKKGRHLTLLIAGAAFRAVAKTGVFAQSEFNDRGPPTKKRYLAEYTASGDLMLPKNFNEWVFVGSPLTPNALNGGKAKFPEFHNVYIEPSSYELYKKTGEFPEGTIFFKELQLTLPAENPDGSRTEASGRGFFPGKLNGADVVVKDSKRSAGTRGWGYYNFYHDEPKALTAKLQPKSECAFCHMASAKKDDVWTQILSAAGQMKSSTRYRFIEATNSSASARRLYELQGLVDTAVDFVAPWGSFA